MATYQDHFLPIRLTVDLCPFSFPRITFHLKVLVAFRSTKAKDLFRSRKEVCERKETGKRHLKHLVTTNLRIISYKRDTMTRINGTGAKVTLLKTHLTSNLYTDPAIEGGV